MFDRSRGPRREHTRFREGQQKGYNRCSWYMVNGGNRGYDETRKGDILWEDWRKSGE